MGERDEKANGRVRVQVDLTRAEATLMELLQKRLSVRSRADLLQQAYGSFCGWWMRCCRTGRL